MDTLTVSLELISPKAKRPLGTQIEAVVNRWLDKRGMEYFYSDDDLKELSKIIETQTGMLVDVAVRPNPNINMRIAVVCIPGHQGTTYNGVDTAPVTISGKAVPTALRKLKIDLDKPYVNGSVFDGFRSRLTIDSGTVTNREVNLSAEEITSMFLHELGHCFNQYMTLGDYVWLNYILQDGVEVVQGKKPNVYKLEVLSGAGLNKYCADKELLKRMKAEPTDENLRRALLVSTVNAPRHHLTGRDNNLSLVREEQLADLFSSRMGYTRALVSAQAKTDKLYGSRWRLSQMQFAIGETLKLLTAVGGVLSLAAGFVAPPAWLASLGFITANRVMHYPSDKNTYDNEYERVNKLRRDLVAQLKTLRDDRDLEMRLLDDIKVVDALLVDYRNNTTLWEMFSAFLSPQSRRQRHQRAKEEQLERLLNNDLFVASSTLNTLLRKS